MTGSERIERVLPQLLEELAAPGVPDYTDDLLSRTAALAQRPAWTFPERWLPVDAVTYRLATVPRLPLRTLGLVALLLAALLGALLYSGSQPRVPAPFGLARTGLVAYAADGDIFTADPATGASTLLVGGPTVDTRPFFSPSGTHVAFVREASPGLESVHVIGVDGGEPVLVTPEPLTQITSLLFSPDGRSVVVSWLDLAAPTLSLYAADGSGGDKVDLPYPAERPVFLPPDGSELLLVGGTGESQGGQGIFGYDVASGDLRTIVAPMSFGEVVGTPSPSADGRLIAYGSFPVGAPAKVVVVDADGRQRTVSDLTTDLCCEAYPAMSHDGTRIALVRWYEDGRSTVAIVPVDGGAVLGEFPIPDGATGPIAWSPDDRWILYRPDRDVVGDATKVPDPQLLYDVAAGALVDIPWQTTSDPTWQRLAP